MEERGIDGLEDKGGIGRREEKGILQCRDGEVECVCWNISFKVQESSQCHESRELLPTDAYS